LQAKGSGKSLPCGYLYSVVRYCCATGGSIPENHESLDRNTTLTTYADNPGYGHPHLPSFPDCHTKTATRPEQALSALQRAQPETTAEGDMHGLLREPATEMILKLPRELRHQLFTELRKISGGYNYMGVASDQLCFPLKAGGELRFMTSDKDFEGLPEDIWPISIDHYDGALPPCISGPSSPTGTKQP
jgi:hypothetical protein